MTAESRPTLSILRSRAAPAWVLAAAFSLLAACGDEEAAPDRPEPPREAGETRAGEPVVVVPPRAMAGGEIEVRWTGPGEPRDYVTLVPPEAPADARGEYVLAREGSPASLSAPESTGTWEVRYVSAGRQRILARDSITLVPVFADLVAADSAPAGSELGVRWVGPAGPDDYITIVPAGAPEGERGNYVYTRIRNPSILLAPDVPGRWEIRYVDAREERVLAREPITLLPVSATVQAPDRVGAGTRVEIRWTGPARRKDYLTIVRPGAPGEARGEFAYTLAGSPVTLPVPDSPGTWEIRYVSGQSNRVLARKRIRVE